jgi:hypothetical protein
MAPPKGGWGDQPAPHLIGNHGIPSSHFDTHKNYFIRDLGVEGISATVTSALNLNSFPLPYQAIRFSSALVLVQGRWPWGCGVQELA